MVTDLLSGATFAAQEVLLPIISIVYLHATSVPRCSDWQSPLTPYVAKVEIWIDGELDHVAALPMRNTDRKVEPAWKYLMKEGRHHVKMKWLNRKKDYIIRINDIMYYSEKKEHDRFYFNK